MRLEWKECFTSPFTLAVETEIKTAINHSSGDPSLAAGSALNYLAPRRDLNGENAKTEK